MNKPITLKHHSRQPPSLRTLLRITPQQLRAFEATVRTGSVTKAALQLHVSQPTISAQLKELAHSIGEPLFESVGRGIRLTETGELLQSTVQALSECWLSFEAQRADLHGLLQGRLRIAAVTTAEYFVPDLVGPFAAAHAGVEIDLVIENRDRIVERLRQGLDDLTVMMLPPDDLPLTSLPFLENPLVVLASIKNPLAKSSRLRLSQLKHERWLMRETGSGTRRVTEAYFEKKGFQPSIAMTLGSNEAIKHAVAAELGIAVLSKLALDRGDQGLCALPVQGFPLKQQWKIVWRRDRRLSRAAKQFTEYAQEKIGH